MVLGQFKQHHNSPPATFDEEPRHTPNYYLAQIITLLDQERDQWIIWITIAFGAGAAFYFSLNNEPGLVLGPAVFLAALCLKYALPPHTLTTVAFGLVMCGAAGFSAAKFKTEWVRAPVLKAPTRAVEVTGHVVLVEQRLKGAKRLTIRPTKIKNISDRFRPQLIRITVSGNLVKASPSIKSGDFITLKAKLNPPPTPALPGGYDFARYAWFKKLGGVGYAVSPLARLKDSKLTPALSFNVFMQTLRRSIGARIEAVLSNETGAIATALITGERGAISDFTNEAYRGAGLYHILSISGLHMAIMGGSVYFVLRVLFALLPMIALRYPIKKWAAVGAIIGSFAYLLISGDAFATIRSFIMIVMMFLAILVDRPAIALRNVAIAALVILIIFPESILDPGFQMSFAAVTALTAGFELIRSRTATPDRDGIPIWRRLLWPFAAVVLSTLIASAAVAPFAIYHFHNAQHYSVLSNLIAMPVCNLIVMPAALLTLLTMPLGLEAGPLIFMGFGIDLMTKTAIWVSDLPGSVSHPPALANHVFALVVTGGFILLVVRQAFRLVGLAFITLGIALAPGTRLPDILIGRDASLVAMKNQNGFLEAHSNSTKYTQQTNTRAQKQNSNMKAKPPFELVRWMEYFGDRRPAHAALSSQRFKCDYIGCTVHKMGLLITLTKHPAAYLEDCRNANILIINDKAPRYCEGPRLVIDKYAIRKSGTHAIYINDNGSIELKTVAQVRGNRPWAH